MMDIKIISLYNKILNKLKIPCIFFCLSRYDWKNKIFTTDEIEHIINFSKRIKIKYRNKKELLKNLYKKNKIKNLIYVKKIVKNK